MSSDAERVLPSVLDRLLNDDPSQEREPPFSASKLARILRDAIRRDVEDFLNTRKRATSLPQGLRELEATIVDHGISDLVGQNFASKSRQRKFLRELESRLRISEPRFKSLEIYMSDRNGPSDRTLSFRIEALMFADPAPEQISLDSSLEPVMRTFQVKL